MGPNQDWVQNENARLKLLDWLDQGANSDGQRYAEVCRRLELYFDRKNCVGSSDLAEETLHRVARKVAENGDLSAVDRLQYCFDVAKYVFLEALRDARRAPFYRAVSGANPNGSPGQSVGHSTVENTSEYKLNVADCLQRSVENLSRAERDLIVEYYRGPQRGQVERRAILATRLGVSASTLSTGASSIRQRIETAVQGCQKKSEA